MDKKNQNYTMHLIDINFKHNFTSEKKLICLENGMMIDVSIKPRINTNTSGFFPSGILGTPKVGLFLYSMF